MLSENLQSQVSEKVWKMFPDFKGIEPSIRQQETPAKPYQSKSLPPKVFLFIYQVKQHLSGGQPIQRWIRVNIDEQGRILKVSTSK